MQQISCDRQAEWLDLFNYLLTQYELNRSVLGMHAMYAAVSVSAGVCYIFNKLVSVGIKLSRLDGKACE